MAPFSGLGIGLSFVFGCVLLGLVAELYYVLWWKKRITKRELDDENRYTSIATEVSYISCWKKPNTTNKVNARQELSETVRNTEANGISHEQLDPEQGIGKDLSLKDFGEEYGAEESELMRLHNLCGPPRFLFTIKEETKEDLESDDGRSKGDRRSRTRSLSDQLIIAVDTPFLTPLASPPIKAQYPNLDCYSHHGFNPLFESIASDQAELKAASASSPPPKFKFLRDAEEKLMRRLMEEAEKRALMIRNKGSSMQDSGIFKTSSDSTVEGSFLSFIGKNKERELHHQLPLSHSSAPSQVLPLASSPPTFTPGVRTTSHTEQRGCV